MTNTPEYAAWRNMINRCYNPSNPSFQNYGGRDIRLPAGLAITVWLRSRFRVIQGPGANMSRGLGKLQRAILTHLQARAGGDPLGNHDPHHTNIILAAGWHDLRRVSREINGGE